MLKLCAKNDCIITHSLSYGVLDSHLAKKLLIPVQKGKDSFIGDMDTKQIEQSIFIHGCWAPNKALHDEKYV